MIETIERFLSAMVASYEYPTYFPFELMEQLSNISIDIQDEEDHFCNSNLSWKIIKLFEWFLKEKESLSFRLMEKILNKSQDKTLVTTLYLDPNWSPPEISSEDDIEDDELVEMALWIWEKEMKQKTEKSLISPRISISSALNKLPALWIDTIYTNLGLSGDNKLLDKKKHIKEFLSDRINVKTILRFFGKSHKEMLHLIMDKGGIYPYHRLMEKFGSDEEDGFLWNEMPPVSIVGQLRSFGIITVGMVKKNNKKYKVALIPYELRPILKWLFSFKLVKNRKKA